MSIILKSVSDIEKLRESCQISKKILDELSEKITVDTTTAQIDDWAVKLMKNYGVSSATLGYGSPENPFPSSICTSINHVVCHGIPNHRRLKSGDILNIDITVIKDGWYGDMSRMYLIGETSPAAQRLVKVAYDSLQIVLNMVKPNIHLGDIGNAIQQYVEKQNMSVVRDYCGHGIGQSFHEAPQVLHYGKKGTGVILKEGMTFTIEPMVNLGKSGTKVLLDGWTVVTRDKKFSAQWEHTIAVTSTGVDVLTL